MSDQNDGELNLNLTDSNNFQATKSVILGLILIDEKYLAIYERDSSMLKIFNYSSGD